jgi:hypothetical protein
MSQTNWTPPTQQIEYDGPVRPHRGGMILAFGILSWVLCFIFGIVAWVMGNADLAEMRAGRMDPSGEGLTQAGRILGMVHILLFIVGMLLFVVFFILAGALSVAGSGGGTGP